MPATTIESKISKLEKKALAQGHYALAAAAAHALQDVGDIHRQINLVGALHESAYLQNTLLPYWKEFRADESAWTQKCLSRLVSTDHDYWALAALLGCNGPNAVKMAADMGFKSVAVRSAQRYDKPDVHIHTLYLNATQNTLHPLLEIGYDAKDMTVVDMGRARALSLNHSKWTPGEWIGNGWLALSMQAKLPYGAWRTPSARFEMKKEWLIQPADG